ncbi:MAG: tRNA (5-methylaminomethyl-2-thiouridine)(34)-methyltransferase MnmD [Pseudomonadota bacterium]
MTAPDPTAPPALDWTEGGAPISRAYDDVYYSREDGRDETQHVFLAGNGMPERWRGRPRFAIGELGFGVGLNFLTVWRALDADPEAPARLDYASVEAHPPEPDAIRRAIARWPDLEPYAEALLAAGWPPPPGLSTRTFDRVSLTLWVGDVAAIPQAWARETEAWFLDGFTPAKNPAMWSAELMAALAARTAPEGTVATYAAAGWVRRNLLAAGFAVARRPGYGRKRDMLAGRLSAPPNDPAAPDRPNARPAPPAG